MSDQPEALRLADDLDVAAGDYTAWDDHLGRDAAEELRRQHSEIEALKAERNMLQRIAVERDALLKNMHGYIVDAARYRYLRDFSPGLEYERKNKIDIDSMIDFARSKA